MANKVAVTVVFDMPGYKRPDEAFKVVGPQVIEAINRIVWQEVSGQVVGVRCEKED